MAGNLFIILLSPPPSPDSTTLTLIIKINMDLHITTILIITTLNPKTRHLYDKPDTTYDKDIKIP